MNCKEAQDALLDALLEPISDARRELLEHHLAGCANCRRFAAVQQHLDARLAAAVPAGVLSADFRRSLRGKLHDRPAPAVWPDYLPDVAHLAGCGLAIALLLLFLPQYSKTVLTAGAGFTAVTYFSQAVLRSSLERL